MAKIVWPWSRSRPYGFGWRTDLKTALDKIDTELLDTSLDAVDTTAVNAPAPKPPRVIPVLVPSGADGSVDFKLDRKFEVYTFKGFMKGAGTAGSDIKLNIGGTDVTDLIDVSIAGDKDAFVATEYDDAANVAAVGATIAVVYTSTGGDFPGAQVFIEGVERA